MPEEKCFRIKLQYHFRRNYFCVLIGDFFRKVETLIIKYRKDLKEVTIISKDSATFMLSLDFNDNVRSCNQQNIELKNIL